MPSSGNQVTTHHMWQTLAGRVIFAFQSEARAEPQVFFTSDYLLRLVDQEKELQKLFQKIFLAFIILNALSLVYIQGLKADITVFGINWPSIPAAPQILCFVLGMNIFGLSLTALDMIVLSRMRVGLVMNMVHTDMPNIRMAHIKSQGIWVDLLMPRFIGFSSGALHKFLSVVMLIVLFGFWAAVFVAAASALFATYHFGLKVNDVGFNWPYLVSLAGLVLGTSGIVVFFLTQLVPFRFKLTEQQGA